MLEKIDASLPRKQREKLYKRREILLAALKVFAEKGYEHANIEEIAIAAEFSKGALYNYFLNKEEIFIALMEEGFADFERIVLSSMRRELSVRDQYREFTVQTLNYFDENPDYFTLIIKENLQMKIKLLSNFRERFAQKRLQLLNIMAAPLKSATEQGLLRPFDPIQLVEVFWNVIFSFLLHSRCQEQRMDIQDDTDAILTIFFNGVEKR